MKNLEKQILAVLKDDSRLSAENIAVMLGQKTESVSAVISDLEKRGVIVKYSLVVNGELLDSDRVEALIEVKVSPMRANGFDSIAEDIYRFDEVKSVYLMSSGAYDLAVFIEGKNLKEVASFVSEKLSCLDKVLSTATHFILKKYKTDGVVLGGGQGNERQAFQP